jgi:hypothetical protein
MGFRFKVLTRLRIIAELFAAPHFTLHIMSDSSSSDEERVKTCMHNYLKTNTPKCPFCNKATFKDLKALEQHATTFGGMYVEH